MAAHETYEHDLAISAVPYDALLVADLVGIFAMRLSCVPLWRCASPTLPPSAAASALLGDQSRVALILAQRLWGRDDVTAADAAILQERARHAPRSVVVVSLDAEPLPPWMARLRHRDLATLGIDGVAEFVADVITRAGGKVRPRATPLVEEPVASPKRWPDMPTPFLGQARAHSALRRELDAIAAAVKPRTAAVAKHEGARGLELHTLPNRVVALLDAVGVSFSWVPGRMDAVSDGRLMVIEWSGIAEKRGPDALRTAHPVRERVYTPETSGADEWRWRADGPNGRACSTANLVGEWMDGARMTAHALMDSHTPAAVGDAPHVR